MQQLTNEQIAHDLAVAYVADGWRSVEIAERESVNAYLSKYNQFLKELNQKRG